MYAKIWRANKDYYGIFESGLFMVKFSWILIWNSNLNLSLFIYFFSIADCFHLFLHVANAPESDKRDLKSELELMKTLKPHPYVIKLLGCVTESGK